MSTYFSKTHEVIQIDNNIATLNITNHAINELGDVVYVELPEQGSQVAQGEAIIIIESVKAAADVYAPVSGEIISVNEKLVDEPSIINELDQTTGWLIKMKLDNSEELEQLMDEAAYMALIE